MTCATPLLFALALSACTAHPDTAPCVEVTWCEPGQWVLQADAPARLEWEVPPLRTRELSLTQGWLPLVADLQRQGWQVERDRAGRAWVVTQR